MDGALPDGAPSDVGSTDDAGSSDDFGVKDGGEEDAASADAGALPDPELAGPYALTTVDDSITVAATGNTLPLHCALPATAGSYGAAVLLHGFQIDGDLYHETAAHLAAFGFVVCVPDYQAGFIPNHLDNSADISAAIDWMLAEWPGLIDPSRIATIGHSLGGKIAFLTAAFDTRVAAVVGLDPVDSSMFCNDTNCPDASELLPIPIPTALLGETVDSAGPGQACAPAADNYQTFFEAADSPSLEVTFTGANHVSFVDDPDACGITCSFCNPATAAHEDVVRMIRAYSTAFLLRHLNGEVGYDDFLTGTIAEQRYVTPGYVTLRSK